MNPKITELVDRLDGPSEQETAELRDLIVDGFTQLDGEEDTGENTRALAALAAAADKLLAHTGQGKVAKLRELTASGARGSAVASLAQANAQRDQAQLNLSYTTVTAAQPGRAVELTAAVGQFAQPGNSKAAGVQ